MSTKRMNNLDGMRTILVVDDDPEELASTCTMLTAGYAVIAASCGTEAIRLASENTPDVIVLDVILQGGKDGFSIFRDLGNHSATSGIPVIFLTNVNEITGMSFGAKEVNRILKRKPAAFLEKPVSPAVLIREVAKAIAHPLKP